MRTFLAPNRIAIYLTGLASVATAIAPAVANLDTHDTIALVSGLGGIVLVVIKFLTGWQAFEQRQHYALQSVETAELPPAVRTDVALTEAA